MTDGRRTKEERVRVAYIIFRKWLIIIIITNVPLVNDQCLSAITLSTISQMARTLRNRIFNLKVKRCMFLFFAISVLIC